MFQLTDPFHVGMVVADLEAAMAELSAGTGVTWHSVQSLDLALQVGAEVKEMGVRFTYSVEGPLQIELTQGTPGSFWDASRLAGLNHLGYWTDDLVGDVDLLLANGHELVFTAAGETDGPEGFAYLRPPTGLQVELIDRAMLPLFEGWFAGGDFAL